MFTKLLIWWLKRRLRSKIISYREDYVFYQCGNDVLDIITGGEYSRRKADIEARKEQLRAIDPNFPKAKP